MSRITKCDELVANSTSTDAAALVTTALVAAACLRSSDISIVHNRLIHSHLAICCVELTPQSYLLRLEARRDRRKLRHLLMRLLYFGTQIAKPALEPNLFAQCRELAPHEL